MNSKTQQPQVADDELYRILEDVAEAICDEWCSGDHTGAKAVNTHMRKEKQAITRLIEREKLLARIEERKRMRSDWLTTVASDDFEERHITRVEQLKCQLAQLEKEQVLNEQWRRELGLGGDSEN